MRFIECEYKNHLMDFHAKNEVAKWIKKFTIEKHKELQKNADDKFKKSKAKSKKRKIIPQLPEPRVKTIKGHRLQIYSDYTEYWFIDELATFMEKIQILIEVSVYEKDSEAVMKADSGIDLSSPLAETLNNADFKCTLQAQFEKNQIVKVPDTFCSLIQRIKHEGTVLSFDVVITEDFIKLIGHLLNIPLEEEKQSIHKGHTNMTIMLKVTIGVIESDYQLDFSHYYIPELSKDTEEPLFVRYVFSIKNYRTIKQDTDAK